LCKFSLDIKLQLQLLWIDSINNLTIFQISSYEKKEE